MNQTTPARYAAIAIALHWAIAVCFIFLIGVGVVMTNLPSSKLALTFKLFQLHKSVGITVLILSVARVAWRLAHPAPPLPASVPIWQRRTAHAVQAALYILMLATPLAGWAVVSAASFNIPTVLFGLIPWPHLPVLPDLQYKKEVEAVMKNVHGFLAYGATALLILHVAAALKHHLINRDNVLTRMMPFLKRHS